MESFADNSVRLFAAQGMVYEKFSYILLWPSMGTLVLMSASVKSCQADSAHPLVKADIALHGNPISALRDVTCHMGSHSVACQPTQVNAPRLTPAMQAGTRFAYLVYLIAPRPGVEPAIFRSRVRRRTAAPPRQPGVRQGCVLAPDLFRVAIG